MGYTAYSGKATREPISRATLGKPKPQIRAAKSDVSFGRLVSAKLPQWKSWRTEGA